MDKAPLIFGFITVLVICFLVNPSGNSWHGQSDFSVPGPAYNFWMGSAVACAAYLLIMLVIAFIHLKGNLIKAFFFVMAVAAWIYLWVYQIESRGQSLMSSSTILYVLVVFGVCMSLSITIAVKDKKG